MKVVHISTVDMGLHGLLLNQLRYLRDAGYEVSGISSPGPRVAEIEAAGIRHIAVPMTRRSSPLADLRALSHLYRIMRRERFDIVHTHTPKAALLGQYAALLARVPIRVHTIHGLYFPGHMKPGRRWVYVLLERITMAFSHLNLSQNPEDIPVAIEDHICAPGRLRLLGNGIDLVQFDPSTQTAERRSQTRAKIDIEPHHRVVSIVARFVIEKGYLEMLNAVRIIKDRATDVRFVFVGPIEPEKRDALDPQIIDEMGLSDVIRFLGSRDDVADLYAITDVFALPSHREGFPRAPMEAAAMGVPSVVTNIRGCRQVVVDGETGYLVPVGDAQALAERLLELLDDENKRTAFGRAARQKALTEFNEVQVFARVLDAYVELLSGRVSMAAVPERSDT